MTKTLTKVVAGLGIATGLSVAALPFATHAVDVTTSVSIAASNNAGTCTVTSAVPGTPSKCTGGGNSANGYTITIADKDGTKFRLSSTDAAGGTTGGLAPISASATTVSGTNVYGLRFSAAGSSSNAYTGAYTGSFVTNGEMTGSSGAGAKYVPVKATSIGTIMSASPGLVDVTTEIAESHNLTIANGNYRNTITIVYAAK